MSPDTVMLLFDLIIFAYGIYGIFSALRMKKSGVPSKILVSLEEINKVRNPKKLCEETYMPTLIFGAMACAYGVVELLNQYVIRRALVDLLGVICFVIVCVWYCRKVRDAKENNK